MPDSVETIEGRAWFECRELRKISIPAGVKRIGSHAFGERLYYRHDAPQPYEVYVQYRQFWLSGYAGSEAERYAKRNDLTFIQV